MTEAEWATCREPHAMLEFLRNSGRTSERRCRRFACACVRRIWSYLSDDRSRAAVEVVEGYLDGRLTIEAVLEAHNDARNTVEEYHQRVVPVGTKAERRLLRNFSAAVAAALVSTVVQEDRGWTLDYLTAAEVTPNFASGAVAGKTQVSGVTARPEEKKEREAQAALLRDIFGPLPFREVVLDLAWDDGTVKRLAEAAYAERVMPAGTLDIARMGVLGDALEEAGCQDQEILRHCREQGIHVRGCWLLDTILACGQGRSGQ